MRVLIAGAGLTGAYTAYWLAKSGAEVLIIDPCVMEGRASDANPGGLNPLHGPGIPGPMSDFALRSYHYHLEEWETVESLSGLDFRGCQVERIMLSFAPEDTDGLKATASLYRETSGFNAHWLHASELRKFSPTLSAEALGGLLTQGNASVDSLLYNRALLAAAERMGAQRFQGQVDNIDRSERAISAVWVDGNVFAADQFVFCTGAWMKLLEDQLGCATTIEPVKGQLLIAQLERELYPYDVTWGQFGFYYAGDSKFWLGGTREESGFDLTLTEQAKTGILDGIEKMLPGISHGHIVDHCRGLRPMSSDGLPLLGRLGQLDNAFIANGGGVKGVLLSAGMGRVLADQLISGSADPQFAFLSPDRASLTTAD